jgi:hypothetical protein
MILLIVKCFAKAGGGGGVEHGLINYIENKAKRRHL